jgi:WD40 repeat protein
VATVLVVTLAVIVGAVIFGNRHQETQALLSRSWLGLPPEASNTSVFHRYPNSLLAISPNGKHVAIIGGSDESICIRDLDTLDLRKLSGTEHARNIFFGPNGESLAFFTED